MSNSTKLLDHLIQVKNLSGAIKNAPHTLKNLKGSIDGVPFQLLMPGMSGVMDLQKIMQAITQLAGQLGGIQNLGNFGNMFGKLNGLASNLQQIGQINPSQLASRIGLDEITAAMGDAGTFAAALSQFAPQSALQELNKLTGQTPNAGLDGVNQPNPDQTTLT